MTKSEKAHLEWVKREYPALDMTQEELMLLSASPWKACQKYNDERVKKLVRTLETIEKLRLDMPMSEAHRMISISREALKDWYG